MPVADQYIDSYFPCKSKTILTFFVASGALVLGEAIAALLTTQLAGKVLPQAASTKSAAPRCCVVVGTSRARNCCRDKTGAI